MRKFAALLALTLAASTAFAQSDTLTTTATKPAASITIAFQDTTGTDLPSKDLGTFSMNETKALTTVLFADYTNLGEDSDVWTVTFAADPQPGYSYQYRVDANDGTNVTEGATKSLSTATGNTVPSGAYGDSSGYLEADAAPALGTAVADADHYVFLIQADSGAKADLNTTITATLTYN